MTKNRTPTPVYLDPGMPPGLEVKGLIDTRNRSLSFIKESRRALFGFMAYEFFGRRRQCHFYTSCCVNIMTVTVTGRVAKWRNICQLCLICHGHVYHNPSEVFVMIVIISWLRIRATSLRNSERIVSEKKIERRKMNILLRFASSQQEH